ARLDDHHRLLDRLSINLAPLRIEAHGIDVHAGLEPLAADDGFGRVGRRADDVRARDPRSNCLCGFYREPQLLPELLGKPGNVSFVPACHAHSANWANTRNGPGVCPRL